MPILARSLDAETVALIAKYNEADSSVTIDVMNCISNEEVHKKEVAFKTRLATNLINAGHSTIEMSDCFKNE